MQLYCLQYGEEDKEEGLSLIIARSFPNVGPIMGGVNSLTTATALLLRDLRAEGENICR